SRTSGRPPARWLSASSSRNLPPDAHAAAGHHELAGLVAELGDLLAEPQPPGAALLLPRLARPGRAGQDVAHPERPVVGEVLLRVQPAGALSDQPRAAARAVPRRPRSRSQPVLWVELRGSDGEGRRRGVARTGQAVG